MIKFLLVIIFASCPAWSFLFTSSCSTSCFVPEPEDNVTDTCNPITGECLHGCQAGYAGPNCSVECSPTCRKSDISSNQTCNATDGECFLGCNDGYFGSSCNRLCTDRIKYCKTCTEEDESVICTRCFNNFLLANNGTSCNCSSWCSQTDDLSLNCDADSGECKNGCTPGRYGRFCDQTCSNNCKNDNCERYTGKCVTGCTDTSLCGYACATKCSNFCLNRTCDQSCACSQGCVFSNWGQKCERLCEPNCAIPSKAHELNVCDIADGTCIHGCRGSLFWGNKCSNTCPVNCKFGQCQQDSGRCKECVNKKVYGDKCDQKCNEHCVEGTCNREDGYCDKGCVSGWYGNQCETSCSNSCDSDYCRRENGHCRCKTGWHGLTCSLPCDINCAHSECDRTTGDCIYGCTEGSTCGKSKATHHLLGYLHVFLCLILFKEASFN